ncbi:MAG: ATP synthase A1 subunit C [Candidatus Methanomethylophilaceae archaeon]|nr:ATP synthase A1 subunit C [Candidatus Methanomethylophilaceae archaeon]
MFGRKGKKGNYAYTVARVKAKKSALLKEDAYSKMLMMSLPEISRFISESGYQKEITELTGKYNGVDLIEHATYANMANLFKGILDSAEGELKDMIAADLERWDAWNLKVILRGKSFGLDMDQMKEDLVPAGRLGLAQLETLMGYGSEEEIVQAYGKFVDLAIPQNVLATYGEEKNLAVIEDYLDKAYYERLLLNVDPSSRPKRLFQDFIRNEIDITNLETILKLKKEGITGDVILGYYIPGGAQIDKKLATQLANADSVSAMANDLAQLDFYEDIKDALDDSKSLKDIVAALTKYHRKQAKTFTHLYPLSVIPVIDFMIHKETEVNNIRIIARGIESGLDKEIIKGLLVV